MRARVWLFFWGCIHTRICMGTQEPIYLKLFSLLLSLLSVQEESEFFCTGAASCDALPMLPPCSEHPTCSASFCTAAVTARHRPWQDMFEQWCRSEQHFPTAPSQEWGLCPPCPSLSESPSNTWRSVISHKPCLSLLHTLHRPAWAVWAVPLQLLLPAGGWHWLPPIYPTILYMPVSSVEHEHELSTRPGAHIGLSPCQTPEGRVQGVVASGCRLSMKSVLSSTRKDTLLVWGLQGCGTMRHSLHSTIRGAVKM